MRKLYTRRGLVATASAALVAMTLTACGADAGAASPSSDSAGDTQGVDDGGIPGCTIAEPCEISFRWWGGESRAALQQQVLDAFMEQHPEIVVRAEPVSWDGYYQVIGVELAAGNAPDVFTMDDSWPLEYGMRGGLVDLNTMSSVLDLSPFTEEMLAASTAPGGELFGMPIAGNAVGIAANLDILEELGIELPDDETWTWEDLTDLAAEITGASGGSIHGLSHLISGPFLRLFANQSDGGLFTRDGEINVSEAGLAHTFQLSLTMMEAGATPIADAQSEQVNLGPSEWAITMGTAAMQPMFVNQMPAVAEASGANIVLLRNPGDAQSEHGGTWMNPSQFAGVAANSRYPEAAALLVNFMVNDLEANRIMGLDRGLPFNQEMAAAITPYLTEAQVKVADYMERIAADSGPNIPMPQGASEVFGISHRLSEGVLFGLLSPDVAAAQWLTEVQAALDAAE